MTDQKPVFPLNNCELPTLDEALEAAGTVPKTPRESRTRRKVPVPAPETLPALHLIEETETSLVPWTIAELVSKTLVAAGVSNTVGEVPAEAYEIACAKLCQLMPDVVAGVPVMPVTLVAKTDQNAVTAVCRSVVADPECLAWALKRNPPVRFLGERESATLNHLLGL